MILKPEVVTIYPKKAKGDFPLKFRVEWSAQMQEFILCSGIFHQMYFSLEDVEDMKKILTKYNREVKNGNTRHH